MVAVSRLAIRQAGAVDVQDYGASTSGDCGTQVAAAETALAAAGGGELTFGPGTWNVTSLGPHTMAAKTHWKGRGKDVTTLSFASSDLGSADYVLKPASQTTTTHKISDMKILGPASTLTIGTNPCNASGIKCSREMVLTNVHLDRFSTGAAIWADHITWRNVKIENSYVARRFISSSARGDNAFYDTIMTGGLLAATMCDAGTTIETCDFHHDHVVSTPFGILRTGAHTTGFVSGSRWRHAMFENVGNSLISDLSTGGQNSWLNSSMDCDGWVQSDSYKYASLANDYVVHLPNNCSGGYIRSGNNQIDTGGVALGVYNLGGVLDIISTTLPNTCFAQANRFWRDDNGVSVIGGTSKVASGTITAGDIVEYTTADDTVQRATGMIGVKPIAGVALKSATNGQIVMVSDGNIKNVQILTETVASGGLPLAQKTGTWNVLGLASNYPGNPVVGYSVRSGGNSGVTALTYVRAHFVGHMGGAQGTYTASNVTTDRSYDANSTTLDEVADVLGTLIADLRARGIVL